MRIALVGMGKMGRAVADEALARGHVLVSTITRQDADAIHRLDRKAVDVVIEFTQPEAVLGHVATLMRLGMPTVVGTTGWDVQRAAVAALVAEHGGALLYGANFSVGVNVMFAVNELLARLMDGLPQYDVLIEERHHRHKADAPSGTALALGQQIMAQTARKTHIAAGMQRPAPDALSIGHVRAGEIPGTHRVVWESDIDQLTVEHVAFSRRGFALGAVLAAEWLVGRQGFFSVRDMFR